MKIHVLKTESIFFNAAEKGIKHFEVRKNDRDYQVGDLVMLLETVNGEPTGIKSGWREIVFILHGGQYGIDPGYCVIGFDR